MSARRVAIVGAGVMGRLHARAIARRGRAIGDCEVAFVIDRHRDRSTSVAEEFGGTSVEMHQVDWSSVDAAVVAIPTSGHEAMARELIERRLDLLLEKPMALDVRAAQGLATLAEETGCILQVGHTEWYNPGWRRALERAGRPRSIEVDRLAQRTKRGLDIDVVQDFMLHDLDWVTRTLGEEVVTLEARGRSVQGAALDEAEVEMTFASGCRARLRASRVHSQPRRTVRVEGSDGVATADLVTGRLTEEGAGKAIEAPTPPRAGAFAGSEPLDAQWADFLRACEGRKAPANDGRVGVAAVEWVERVRAAIGIRTEDSGDADDPALRR